MLNRIAGDIETVKAEEEDARDGIPESLQGTARYECCETACDAMEDAIDLIQDVVDKLEEIDGVSA